MPQNSELIRKFLPRPIEDLWKELGQILEDEGKLGPTAMIGRLPRRNLVGDAKLWYGVNFDQIYQKVCVDFDFCNKKERYKLDDRLELLAALGSLLAGPVGRLIGGSILAIILFRQGLCSFCGCDTARPYFARAMQFDEDDERQVPLWKRVLEEDPFCSDAYHNLGNHYHRRGRLYTAASNYRTVIDLNPDNFHSLNNLACLLLSENDNMQAALHYAQQAHRLSPSNAEVNHTLGFALLRNGRPCEAIPYLKRAVEAKNDPIWREILEQAKAECKENT